MKRLLIAPMMAAMILLVFPAIPATAGPERTPHQDPDAATGFLDRVAWLLSYSRIINLAAEGQYDSAGDILAELEKADLPEEVRDVIDIYNRLWERMFATLEELQGLLDEATYLLNRNRITEAYTRLEDADGHISLAYSLLEDITAATGSLKEKLGVVDPGAEAELERAYQALEASIARLVELLERLRQLRKNLETSYVRLAELTATQLTMHVDPVAAYVGDSVTASGRLTAGDAPLGERSITILKDGVPAAEITAASSGYFEVEMAVPFEYVTGFALQAVYEPDGDDIDTYLSSQSEIIEIEVMFYRNRLDVAAPHEVYRGLPFSVSGNISSGGNPARYLTVRLDDVILIEAEVSAGFSFEFLLKEDTSLGYHILGFHLDPSGRDSGAVFSRSIEVTTAPLYIDTRLPGVMLLPQTINIDGRVYSRFGPLADARLQLAFFDSSTTAVTSENGSFAGSFNAQILPGASPAIGDTPAASTFSITAFDLLPVNVRHITITVESPGAWASPVIVAQDVITINPLTGGLILVSSVLLGVTLYRTSRKRRITEETALKENHASTPAKGNLGESVNDQADTVAGVINSYRKALKTIEKSTGTGIKPGDTLREFLSSVELPTPAADYFNELTGLAEVWLYGIPAASPDSAARAADLAGMIEEGLGRGS